MSPASSGRGHGCGVHRGLPGRLRTGKGCSMRFKKTTRIAAAVAVIGAVAAGGAAFTASNTVPNTTAGYGTSTITGGTVLSLNYTLSGDGTSITTATIVFQGNTTTDTAAIAFDSGSQTTCGAGTLDGAGNTTYTCNVSGAGVSTSATSASHITLVNNAASGV